jgi:hypothetical protein
MFENFAWSHYLANIHDMMAPDFLHQVLKGLASEHVMAWIEGEINDSMKDKEYAHIDIPRTDKGGKQLTKSKSLLSARFAQVERFAGLSTWSSWATVGQWTGNMYKSLLRQLVPVVAPLLKHNKGAMLFVRAFVDFTVLAQYVAHDDDTINYLTEAMYRMNRTKDAFISQRPQPKPKAGCSQEPANFNFPKWHAIAHYAECIRLFGSISGSDTGYSEAAHIVQKRLFKSTNGRDGFMDQMMNNNTRTFDTTVR